MLHDLTKFYAIISSSRTPRGLSESLDSNALARCRACREACMVIDKGYSIVDSLEYSGVNCRTVSGWKHSSTKATFAGIVSLKSRYYNLSR